MNSTELCPVPLLSYRVVLGKLSLLFNSVARAEYLNSGLSKFGLKMSINISLLYGVMGKYFDVGY